MLPLFLCLSAKASDPSQSKAWLNLLHLENKKSILDAPNFFISGSENPSLELKASLTAIGSTKKFGKLKLPFECAYPARIKFLKSHFDLVLSEKCSDLNQWLKGLNSETLSLVFASYYPNNPASIFGHTFLKINSDKENKISDYAVNYLAITSESNGLIFGLKGLLGFYQGQFSIMPYFLKVNEYNHSESRDLFEYHLNLNKDEIDTLLRHLWELENNGHFNYYFLDDNCSYFMLRLLEVANPNLMLTKKFSFDVIPAETIKAVYNAHAVTKIDYRPSLYTRINYRLRHQSKQNHADELDTLILIEQFKKQARKKWSSQENQNFHKLLQERSTIVAKATTLKILPLSYPHEVHNPKILSLGGGIINEKKITRLSFTPGVHGFMNPEAGYLPFSQVNLLHGSLRFLNTKQVFIDRFTLMDVATLNPHLSWDPKFSWKSKIEYQRFDQDYCRSCKTVTGLIGIGKSKAIGENQVLSLITNAQIVLSQTFDRKWAYGLNPEAMYHLNSKLLNFESSMSLMNRLDEKRVLNSMRYTQAVGFHLKKNHGLNVKFNYYSLFSKETKDRKEITLDWVFYL